MINSSFSGEHSKLKSDVTGRTLRAVKQRAVSGLAILLFLGCGGSVGQASLNGAGGSGPSMGGFAATGGLGLVGTGGTGTVCAAVDCSIPICPPDSTLVTFDGQCCPSCKVIDPSCGKISCLTVNCPSGFVVRREPGACCDTCVAAPGAPYPGCEAVDCGPPTTCPLGYYPGFPDWSCCGACEADPNYCESNDDCVIATKDTGCCSCPASISKRLYADDPCYSSPDIPRPLPAYCEPEYVCNGVSCGACQYFGLSICQNHTCGKAVLLN